MDTEDTNKLQQEVVVDETTALSLPIDDSDLVGVIDDKISAAKKHNQTIKLDERRKLNRDFWKGDQLDMTKLDLRYQVPYIDNLIYDDLETRITLAAGRMPDIITTPPTEDQMSIESAQHIEDFLNFRINSSMMKRLIKRGLRNMHLDFIGVVKCRWDKNKGESGDFVFEVVRANRIGFDHTATIPDDGFTVENCDLIYEWIEEPLSVVLAKFPGKRDKLIAMLGGAQSMNAKRMVSKLRYQECWFRWFDKDGQMLMGKACKYNSLVLHKEKNPYWDWEGSTDIKANDQGVYESKKVFNNYFDQPRMPYMLLTYQNLGEGIMDDTTPVEQAIPIQKVSNKRGAQITELADRVAPRYAFNGSVMSKEEARRVDPKDPTESIWLDSADPDTDIRKGMQVTQSAPPPPILYQDQVGLRSRIDAKFSTNATTKGETHSNESGVSKQITREGDLTVADDMSDIVVERVVYEMSGWALQMVKMFYEEPHLIRYSGKDGQKTFREITQDSVEDGLVAEVKASSVDKQTRRSDAMQLVQAKSIDPQTLFEDLDVDNPKERTRRLIAFQTGINDGYAAYMQEVEGDAEGGQEQTMTADMAQQDLQTILSGQQPQPQGLPGDEYVQIFEQFIQSPDFDQQPPEVQQAIQQYIQQLQQIVSEKAGQDGQQAQGQPQAPAAPAAAQPQAAPPVQAAPQPAAF